MMKKKKDERKIGRNVLITRENSSRLSLAGNSRQIFRNDTWLEVEHHQSKKAT